MYSVPPYFSEDWLNEYYDDKWARRQCQKQQQEQQQEPQPGALAAEAAAGGGGGGNAGCLSSSQQAADAAASSDYRFLYVGPSGSWTPLHSGARGHCSSFCLKLHFQHVAGLIICLSTIFLPHKQVHFEKLWHVCLFVYVEWWHQP
jgi:hypothetical protein